MRQLPEEDILAEIAEDERLARAADPSPWLHSPTARPAGWVYVQSGHDAVHEVAQVRVAADAAHIARQNPVRALALATAARRIVELHRPGGAYAYRDDGTRSCETCGDYTVEWPCPTLRALAEVYNQVDHEEQAA